MSTDPEPADAPTELEHSKLPFLRRVRIRGYKSIAFCDVTLEPLTILVGRNASGKSNFLDALAFLRDVVVKGVRQAVHDHGGADAVLCKLSDEPRVEIEIEANYRPQGAVDLSAICYKFEIIFSNYVARIGCELLKLENRDPLLSGGYTVGPDEWGNLDWPSGKQYDMRFHRYSKDRSYLVSLMENPFNELIEHIASIRTYNFNPEVIRHPQKPDPGWFLKRDGSNLASVIETTREIDEGAIKRTSLSLTAITRSVQFARVLQVGGYELLQFRTIGNGKEPPLEFDAASMSDGTLRTLAALVASVQMALPHGFPSLVAIEEPETALHPAAMRVLVDALDEATLRTQILLTTHSAEMLDNPTIRPDNVRVVQLIDGRTLIGPVDEASIEIVRRKLNTLGGLERENQLEPDLDDQDRQQQLSQAAQESAK